MKNTKIKTKKRDAKSRIPYTRRSEEEMAKIASEIRTGLLGIRSASLKYGLCRNTLKLYLTKQSIRTMTLNTSEKLPIFMNAEPKESALIAEIQKLSKQLEFAKLKILSLETMIEITEKDLQIKIKKKHGTKLSKE